MRIRIRNTAFPQSPFTFILITPFLTFMQPIHIPLLRVGREVPDREGPEQAPPPALRHSRQHLRHRGELG